MDILLAEGLILDGGNYILESILAFGLAFLGVKYVGKINERREERRYNMTQLVGDLKAGGFSWTSEFVSHVLARQYKEAVKVLVTAAEAMKTPEGRMKHFGPIARQNMEAILKDENEGPAMIKTLLKIIPRIIEDDPEARLAIKKKIDEWHILHDKEVDADVAKRETVVGVK